ncbi:serine hydrolase domain-containing protein [Chryseobacterium sp. JV274]|uniref:serine hydrolase domain-containing protein n=1 Tax=Chryseobacterium sp. JV274 TaxID=1932669 RepID=UPI000986078F|nr:serine hydrolase domain-containing protein [Chryseobacterium sp. JV274]CAD0219891.1 Beta-lactamase domain-containing protein [Chryseobacterium sp. JV274]
MNGKIIQSILGFSFTLFLLSCSGTKNVVEVEKVKRDSLYTEIQRIGLEAARNSNVPGVAIAVIQNGKIVWTQCIGFADKENQKPVTTETIFNVGSVSKMVSAWGFMQLTEKGLVNLDDPVNDYLTRWKLPASQYDISKVTLRRILSHTAGLSVHGYGGSEQGTKLLSLEESLSGMTKRNGESVRLISEPGTKWEYSGGGYTLAQLMLEERTKEKFADYMKKNVFKPLGLNHTTYEWTEEMMKNSATAYDASGKPIKNRIFTEQAAAGLQTTVLDLAHFAELSLNYEPNQLHKVLKPSTVQLMEKSVLPFSDKGKSGLGYRFMYYEELETVGHTGENEGWSAGLFMHLPTKSSIVILCNGSNGDRVWFPVYQSWAKRIKAN